MEKHSQSAGMKNARTRRHKGGFVSLCLIAALALVVGTGLFGQRSDSVRSDAENTPVTNLSEAVAEVHHAPEAIADAFEVASDSDYGSYEKGKVLIAVDEMTDLDQLNSALSSSDLVQTKDVSDQDMSAGFVQVDVKSDVSMKQMLASLRSEGLQAQPNYVYHTVADESEADASSVSADADAEDAQALEGQTVQTSDAVQVNDPGVAQQWGMESLDVYRA